MHMASGRRTMSTVLSGFHVPSRLTGRLIAVATGHGSNLGAGTGLLTSPGASPLSLRPLGSLSRRLGLGARRTHCPPGVCTSHGRLGRLSTGKHFTQRRQRANRRLVPACTERDLRPRLPQQSALCAQGQYHSRHQHQQHNNHREQPASGCSANSLRQPQCPSGRHRCPEQRAHPRSSGSARHTARRYPPNKQGTGSC